MPESASGLIRFTPSGFPCGVALTGGRGVSGLDWLPHAPVFAIKSDTDRALSKVAFVQ